MRPYSNKRIALSVLAALSLSQTEAFSTGTQLSVPHAQIAAPLHASLSAGEWDSLERKNASRHKFGLKPITPDEFLDMQSQIQELELQQQQKAAAMSAAAAEMKRESNQENFLDKLFGNIKKDTCESNFDCDSPMVCCNLGFVRKCCHGGGKRRSLEGELAFVPVPVETFLPGEYPQRY